MRVLIAGLALLASAAQADYIATDGKSHVRLTAAECALDIPQKAVMLAASAVIEGQAWVACWAPLNREAILLIYSDGDQAVLPVSAFKRLPEA